MLTTDVEREFENESAVPPGIPKNASRVLKRFFRNYVATWRLQVEIRSLRSLTRAFERASSGNTSHHPCCHTQAPRQVVSGPGSAALRTVEKQKRMLELQRRVSIHPVCDSSIMRDDEGPEIENSSDDSSSSCCEERVSVESVVHKLFLQVEDTKRQAEAKDARIWNSRLLSRRSLPRTAICVICFLIRSLSR